MWCNPLSGPCVCVVQVNVCHDIVQRSVFVRSVINLTDKMANNTLVHDLPANCDGMSANATENETGKKSDNNDITKPETNINGQDDEPTGSQENGTGVAAREDAIDHFLAGDGKNDYDDEILLNDYEDNEGITLKGDNVIVECDDESEKNDESDAEYKDDKPDESAFKSR